MRRPPPPRSVRLHRFAAGRGSLPARLWRAVQRLPLVVPLVAGLAVAGAVDAVLPARAAPVDTVIATNVNTPAAVAGDEAAAREEAVADSMAEREAQQAVQDAADAVEPVVDAAMAKLADAPVVAERVLQQAADNAAEARAVGGDHGGSTRDAAVEAKITAMLQQGQTPYSAVVILEAHTGRVVAMAEHSTRGSSKGLALKPIAPAASVFKVVTASALLESGVSVNEEVCFHGGKTRMKADNIADTRRDSTCMPFGDVVAKSANVAVAKLATRHLDADALRLHAADWGFGQQLGIKTLTPSTANIPDEPFAFAEAAAGFGDVKISAMHGAVLASIVANGGELVPPTFVVGGEQRGTTVVGKKTARALRQMMADTVTKGTGRKSFGANPRLPVSAAGKTGSLTDYKTGLDTSWFVGFAPADNPEYVVAAVVVNTSLWHIKAPWLAKESLRAAIKERGTTATKEKVAAR